MPIQIKVIYWAEFHPINNKNSKWIPAIKEPSIIVSPETISYVDLKKIVANIEEKIIKNISDNKLWSKIHNIEWNPLLPDNLGNIVSPNTTININVR